MLPVSRLVDLQREKCLLEAEIFGGQTDRQTQREIIVLVAFHLLPLMLPLGPAVENNVLLFALDFKVCLHFGCAGHVAGSPHLSA